MMKRLVIGFVALLLVGVFAGRDALAISKEEIITLAQLVISADDI